jgi:hypothetical protein
MTKFFKDGNTYRIAPGDMVDVRDCLPPGNYVVKNMPMAGLYLEVAEPFRVPEKIYGDCLQNCKRILNTFNSRQSNTGVLLVGEKGSGKTLLARQLGIESQMPVIIVNSDHCGDNFNSFLSAITQPCIVMFDEFEKVYGKEEQEKLLTLLDGSFQSQKLFVFTSNDKWSLDNNMKNRPGRIFYLIEFSGLSEEFIREYCEDRLQDKTKVEEIVRVSIMFDKFNFDLLSAFVEEVNRYGDEPDDLIRILNAKPEYSGRTEYVASVQIGSHLLPPSAIQDSNLSVNTITDDFTLVSWFSWRDDLEESLLDRISSTMGSGSSDADTIAEWLDAGHIVPGRKYPGCDEFSTDYIRIEVEPEELTRYEGNCVMYKTDEGYLVQLSKSNKKRKSRRNRLSDY